LILYFGHCLVLKLLGMSKDIKAGGQNLGISKDIKAGALAQNLGISKDIKAGALAQNVGMIHHFSLILLFFIFVLKFFLRMR
jgi:hypothetical protein